MHKSRFGFEERPEEAPQEAHINTTVLNALIYEYLVKRNYSGAAKVFKVEGDVTQINITQGSSALLDWFVAFNDIYNVRSGRSSAAGIATKIDAILGKHSADERVAGDPQGYGVGPPAIPSAVKGVGPLGGSNNWYQEQHKYPLQYNSRPQAPSPSGVPGNSSSISRDSDLLNAVLELDDPLSAPVHTTKRPDKDPGAAHAPMKEVSKLHLHSQRVNSISVCHKRKILVTGGMDSSVCVVDLVTPSDVIRFEPHTMQVSQVKIKDSGAPGSPLYFGSASLDREAKVYKVTRNEGKLDLSLCLVLRGHKSSVKAIDFTADKIYTVGIDGELRIWSMEGACLGSFALRRTVKLMAVRSDTMIVLCDINSISLFNPETASYIKEIPDKTILSMYRAMSSTLFVLNDSVLLFDKTFSSSQAVLLPSDRIHSSCSVGGRIFLGGYQVVYEINDRRVFVSHAHDGVISAIESVVVNSRVLLITGSQRGDIKIWEVPERGN